MNLPELTLDTVIYGNTLLEYIIAAAVLLLSFIAILIIRKMLNLLTRRITADMENEFVAEILRQESKLTPALQYIPFYMLINYLKLPIDIQSLVSKAGIILITICVLRYSLGILTTVMREQIRRENINAMAGYTVKIFASIIAWVLAILFILSNLGFNINTLLAGLGIGGMAVALASQTLLADIFNYFTILMDKPFTIGDTVSTGNFSGTVRSIGIKGTRITSTNGETIVIANTDMTKNAIQNFAVMEKRRVLAQLGVTYDTPRAVMQEIPSLLKSIVQSVDETIFGRAHFSEFGDSALIVELVFFVESKDYAVYMDKKQEVYFKIMEEFERRGIEFAYPTQTIYNLGVKP